LESHRYVLRSQLCHFQAVYVELCLISKL
jgi:hypothetical protein